MGKRRDRVEFSDKPHARGFEHTAALVSRAVRGVSETRGFAESRLLTQWDQICGPDIAATVRPLKVSYARDGIGATLTVTCEGARATEVSMQLPVIRERVNACYGYNAISRVRIAQTDASGFSEARPQFQKKAAPPPPPDPAIKAEVRGRVGAVTDPGLLEELQRLGENILARNRASTARRAE